MAAISADPASKHLQPAGYDKSELLRGSFVTANPEQAGHFLQTGSTNQKSPGYQPQESPAKNQDPGGQPQEVSLVTQERGDQQHQQVAANSFR